MGPQMRVCVHKDKIERLGTCMEEQAWAKEINLKDECRLDALHTTCD